MIERIDDHLWIGDADPEDSRLRIFDLAQDPAAELAPIPSPGAPYLFLPIP